MDALYEKFETLLENTKSDFNRYLYQSVARNSRMLGITGPRGVGKTTMILQYIKENLDSKKALYLSADDLYFGDKRLVDAANDFYKNAGEYLFIDEIHKYADWSRELKHIYDSFPGLKVVFTGSSVLDILKGAADLSRRAPIYTLQGLSFREYLNMFHGQNIDPLSLGQILDNEFKLEHIAHPLPLFNDYLRRGYYPFAAEGEFDIRLGQIIVQTLDNDIPQYANLSVGTARKLKRLLAIIAESAPFKPNFTKIAALLRVSRNSLDDYFSYMEKAGLIGQLRAAAKGIRGLGKVKKVYLDNTNLIFNLGGDASDMGNIRETFFFNQMRLHHEVTAPSRSDFAIDPYTFEIGGKNKQASQITRDGHSYLVKDDIEYGYRNVIPLWAFGLSY